MEQFLPPHPVDTTTALTIVISIALLALSGASMQVQLLVAALLAWRKS
jgi:hypothetical protein